MMLNQKMSEPTAEQYAHRMLIPRPSSESATWEKGSISIGVFLHDETTGKSEFLRGNHHRPVEKGKWTEERRNMIGWWDSVTSENYTFYLSHPFGGTLTTGNSSKCRLSSIRGQDTTAPVTPLPHHGRRKGVHSVSLPDSRLDSCNP